MTEDEAKTKWCPMVRVTEKWPEGVTGSRNRVVICEGDKAEILDTKLLGAACIGSACMMWRWKEMSLTEATSINPNREAKGYCGLAGKI